MMIKVYIVIWLLGVVNLVDTEPVGGLRLRVSKQGLNKAIDYLLENNLIPFVRDYDSGEFSLTEESLDLTVHVNKLKFKSLQGEHAEVILKGNNVVEIVAGFASLQLSANVTFEYSNGGGYQRGPDTSLTFTTAKLEVTLSLGTNNNAASIDLQNCEAKFGTITADGQLKNLLNGVLGVAGGKARELVEKLCPYLEEQSNRYLGNLLDLQSKTSVELPSGQVDLTFQTTSVGADYNDIYVITAVTFTGERAGTEVVDFPDLAESKKDLDISMNLYLLNQLLHKGVDTAAILKTTLGKTTGFPDDIDTLVTTFADSAAVTTKGISLDGSAIISFLSHTNQSELFQISFTGVVPMTLSSSDTELLAVPDTERTQLFFSVTQENMDSVSAAKVKKLQWNIMTAYQDKIDKVLKEHSVQLALPNTETYGIKKTLLHTSKDPLSLSADLRIGSSTSDSQPTVSHHGGYSSKKLEVVFRDGEIRTRKSDITGGASENTHSVAMVVAFCTLLITIWDL